MIFYRAIIKKDKEIYEELKNFLKVLRGDGETTISTFLIVFFKPLLSANQKLVF